jgi:nucleoside phosphorylase
MLSNNIICVEHALQISAVNMTQHRLRHEHYTVGWVCALPIEFAAAQEMLDEKHPSLPVDSGDPNSYILGRIGDHNVVISCLPASKTGTTSATAVAIRLKSTFPSIRFGLMVGVGGGVPNTDPSKDIRLGDVVVSQPCNRHGGVIQYDFGKSIPDGFEWTGFLNAPPEVLLNALSTLQANYNRLQTRLPEYLTDLTMRLPHFSREVAGDDILFLANYDHVGGHTCEQCSRDKLVQRKARTNQDVKIHYGAIASGNRVMRHARERDDISKKLGGVLCFEMEAAGVMDRFPCLVIRGICDYADSHKNKTWQPYAAAAASAYTKELLSIIGAAEVVETYTIGGITNGQLRNALAKLTECHG